MDLVEIRSRECVGDEEIVLKALHPPPFFMIISSIASQKALLQKIILLFVGNMFYLWLIY
jgi:hypothetical protein